MKRTIIILLILGIGLLWSTFAKFSENSNLKKTPHKYQYGLIYRVLKNTRKIASKWHNLKRKAERKNCQQKKQRRRYLKQFHKNLV